MKSRLPLALLSLTLAVSCKSTLTTSETAGLEGGASAEYPRLGFEANPSYIPKDVVILSFDDGPDWNNTAKVLDVLKAKGVKASFFINSENWSNLNTDQPMRDLVKRMAVEGHEIGNHTANHLHLGTLSPADIESQLSKVEVLAKQIAGVKLTLVRAPFGEPFQLADQGQSLQDFAKVAPIVNKHGVHVGWNFDSFDYNCTEGDAQCVMTNTLSHLPGPGKGDHGVILLHSVHSQTAAALPGLIDEIKKRGYKIWRVEDAIKARYGKSSAELMGNKTTTEPAKPPVKPTEPAKPPVKPTEPTKPTQPAAAGCNAPAWIDSKAYKIGEVVTYQGQVFTEQNENTSGFTNPKVSTWFWKAGAVCK